MNEWLGEKVSYHWHRFDSMREDRRLFQEISFLVRRQFSVFESFQLIVNLFYSNIHNHSNAMGDFDMNHSKYIQVENNYMLLVWRRRRWREWKWRNTSYRSEQFCVWWIRISERKNTCKQYSHWMGNSEMVFSTAKFLVQFDLDISHRQFGLESNHCLFFFLSQTKLTMLFVHLSIYNQLIDG